MTRVRGRRVAGAVLATCVVFSTLTASLDPPAGAARADAVAVQATPPGSGSVDIYGEAGTFGQLVNTMPTGQPVTTHPVPGWQLTNGIMAQVPALAADGTVLMGGMSQALNQTQPTAASTVIGALDPTGSSFTNIQLETTTGKSVVQVPSAPGQNREGRGGAPVSDLESIDNGNGVAFVSWVTHYGQDSATEGVWPAFGVLTKGTNGQWGVASGNQWTGQQLRDSYDTTAERKLEACPDILFALSQSNCKGLTEIDTLPVSKDIIATQYEGGGGLVALRLTRDTNGHYTVRVMGHYSFPLMPDPGDPDRVMAIAPLTIQADKSSSSPTDERFAVAYDVFTANADLTDLTTNPFPVPIQEFSYNSVTGTITPASAPIIPVQPATPPTTPPNTPLGRQHLISFRHFVYDQHGNLYVARVQNNGGLTESAGRRMAVFAKSSGQRRTSAAACGFNSADPNAPLESYTTVVYGFTLWGKTCKANYDIVQANGLNISTEQLSEDPLTGDIITVTANLFNHRSELLVIRPSGTGNSMTFKVGNLVDIGKHIVKAPVAPGGGFVTLGPVDSDHRVWLSVGRFRNDAQKETLDNPYFPGLPQLNVVDSGLPAKSWLYAIDLDELFAPAPVVLPTQVGQNAPIQAERTTAVSTTNVTTPTVPPNSATGPGADRDVVSHPHVRGCPDAPCANDLVPGESLLLDSADGWGFSGSVTYTVNAPTAGYYTIGYAGARWPGGTAPNITATIAGDSVTTGLQTELPSWGYSVSAADQPLFVPAGTHTLTISTPDRIFLNWMALTRVNAP